MLQFLREDLKPEICNIVESYDAEKNLYLSGIMAQANIKNRNQREYDLREMMENVTNLQPQIQSSSLMGELDHPDSVVINLYKVSHLITDLPMNGNNVYGKAKILSKTPCGSIAKALVESGVKIGFSTRGTGVVDQGGKVSNCSIVTVDLVGIPSAKDAVPEPIYESLAQFRSGNEALSLAESLQHDTTAQKYFEKAIMKFLKENIFAKK